MSGPNILLPWNSVYLHVGNHVKGKHIDNFISSSSPIVVDLYSMYKRVIMRDSDV